VSNKIGPTNKIDGGEAVLEAFRHLGVDYILSSPGSEWAPVWEALARQKANKTEGPTYIDCWHETVAVGMAIGYTLATGKPQPVLLHAGAGLLQGSMAVHAAYIAQLPMLVMSGEALSYGENPEVDPGSQWYRNLSVVGGPDGLVKPFVKWSNRITSSHTLYETIVRAMEMSARIPRGPVFLNLPVELMLQDWTPPEHERRAPAPPKKHTPAADIEAVAKLLVAAENPFLTTETAGRDPEAFGALVALAERLALPVIESRGSVCMNFPKDHPLYQGFNIGPFMKESDLALVVSSRAPWYPPGNRPLKAKVISVDEDPLRSYMVYQNLQADMYLEGDLAATLRALDAAVQALGVDKSKIEARRAKYAAAHEKAVVQRKAAEADAAKKPGIHPLMLCAALRETLPADAIYVDETITHSSLLQEYMSWNKPHAYFYVQGGLGQGLGVALGVKLANKAKVVALMIGDGSLLYNPIIQGLAASAQNKLPLLIVVFNNRKYASMKANHLRYYPDGIAVATKTFHGVEIEAPDFAKLSIHFGGLGKTIADPRDLASTLREGLATVAKGETAIINVMLTQ
jgi:acetolactate synthase-1/2/3 large subunit